MSVDDLLDERDTRHLLCRAGFGADAVDLRRFPGRTRGAAVSSLLSGKPRYAVGPSNTGRKLADLERLQRWWLRRMQFRRPRLHEKLALFWHDHFPSSHDSGANLVELAHQNAVFRRYGLGPFRDLLHQVTRDPAMLRFLDGRDNRKGAPNENYARELMELFTLGPSDVNGVPNYTQGDVVSMARALTGFRPLGGRKNRSALIPALFDDDTKVLFRGRPFAVIGALGVEDERGVPFPPERNVLDILFRHRDSDGRPTLARFIARKLWAWFAYPDPDLALVDELADAFVEGDYVIRDLVFAILTHDEFYSERARQSAVKTPVDFALQTMNALGVRTRLKTLPRSLQRMGMALFDPPGVNGWAHGEAWLATSQYLARIEFAEQLAAGADKKTSYHWSPARLLDPTLSRADEIVDALIAAMHLEVSADTRSALIRSLDGVDLTGPEGSAPAARSVSALLLTLPEFQVH